MKRVSMRRVALLGLFAGLAVAATPLAASAGYQPDAPVIGVSPSSVGAGDTFTITGQGWDGNSTVQLTISSAPVSLGSVTTDANGSFSVTRTLPCAVTAGSHAIVGNGTAGGAPASASTALTTTSGSICPVSAALALTGLNGDTSLYVGGGALLVLIGAALVVLFRRRHTPISA